MVNAGDTDLADSVLLQETGGGGLTMLGTSSMTIYGILHTKGHILMGDNGAVDQITMAGITTVMSSMTVTGDTQLGDVTTDRVGINRAVETNVGVAVAGPNGSGTYITKFYSGASLAAWIKTK
jgi:hypothetical protein